ncbi:hypothetical protein AAG906_017648 [Vitis piasezkii]
MKVDNKTDVYSFGVVTLEVIIGRHPGELISSLLSSASSSSSSSSSPSTIHHLPLNDVMDQRPSPPVNQLAEEVVVATKLAFECLHVNPQFRPTMQQVARALSTQWPPLSKSFSMIIVRRFFRPEEVCYHEETHSVPVEMTKGNVRAVVEECGNADGCVSTSEATK